MGAPEIVLWIVGFVGVSGFVSAVTTSRQLSRQQRFFRLRAKEDADIVLTTSARQEGGVGIKYMRSVSAAGNWAAATEVAQVLGYGATRRRLRIAVSAEVASSPNGDLVLIGLPATNPVSGLVLEHLNARYPELGLRIVEKEPGDGGCWISLAEYSECYEVRHQAATDIPDRDLALIVLWVNPLTVRKRRLIWCAGFTAYGTSAAARYLVYRMLDDRLARLRSEHPTLPSLRNIRRWVCFAMVIETKLVSNQVVEIRERAFVPLEDPGSPPFGPAPVSSGTVDQSEQPAPADRANEAAVNGGQSVTPLRSTGSTPEA